MLRCVRFGEVLLDETFRTFLICNQCQTEFVEIPEFRVHLATSSCGQRLFKEDVLGLRFGAAQVTRTSKEKTYLLYNPADVQITTAEAVINNTATATTADGGDDAYLDLMKIEEELLDPRWYTDIANAQTEVESPQHAPATATLKSTTGNTNKTLEYKELVEAVGPYVQFKENITKGKQNRIIVRRFSTKANKPAASSVAPKAPATTVGGIAKNTVLPIKRDANADKPVTRLINPAAKRKLDMTPKQVHFKDEVSVKYLENEQLCANKAANAGDNNHLKSLNIENIEKPHTTDGAIIKRRRTMPMDQINMQQKQQKSEDQYDRRCSVVPKLEAVDAKAINASGATKLRTFAVAKPIPATNAPKAAAIQANSKKLVPNPLVIQKQINGTRNPITNDTLIVKNPITYSKADRMENERAASLPLINRVPTATVARSQQRLITTTATSTKPPLVVQQQPTTKCTVSNQTIPPALAPLSSNKISNPAAIAAARMAPKDAQQQTNDILSKLQTRGLQVKRTQPPMAPPTTTAINNNKTMELLQKLQSKGMKVKILNGKEPAATYAPGGGGATTVAQLNASINLPIKTIGTTKVVGNAASVANVANVARAIGTQNKTILNNKLIIKKVN